MQNNWLWDIETLKNLSVFIFRHYKEKDNIKVFVIHELRNDFSALMDFLENCADNGEYLIGFNSLGFDGQIAEALLRNRRKLEGLTPTEITDRIYKKAQSVISNQEFGERIGVPEFMLSLRHIDVFKINHWDNPARKSSLKWLQFTCDWYNVQEMPIHHSSEITTIDEINTVIDYCLNDVAFTGVLYERTIPMIKIRQQVQKKYKINCLNYSNTKLGSELLLKLYSKKTGKKKVEIKNTYKKQRPIEVKNVIFPYITFTTPEFNELLETYKNTTITATKGELKLSVIFEGYEFFYGAGGVHQCIQKGSYFSDDEYIIIDIDVTGLYPNIAVENKMYPAHLGPEFYEVYKEDIVDVRKVEKKKGEKGDKAIVDGFKEAANATFGNSNNKHSWLQDPGYLVQTTVNGQLLISMAVEKLLSGLTKPQLLQTNTDGLTLRFKRSEMEKFKKICSDWEKLTGLSWEFAEYKAVHTFDVNNYFGIYEDGRKPKQKGRFQFMDLEPHKNKSFLVVPKAIYEYLVNGIDPMEFLKSNKNIFDFCAGNRAVGDWEFRETCITEGVVEETKLQKVVRYYISNSGCKIVKCNKVDGRKISTIAGPWLQTQYNVHVDRPIEEYDINYKFYLEQVYKELDALNPRKSNQLTLDLF